MTKQPPDPTHSPSFDSDQVAARYGFERRLSNAIEEARRPPQVVASPSVASAAISRPVLTDEALAEYQRLINDCTVMKAALFNASKRLERKHTAGQFTFALSGIYGFLVPLFALQFEPFLTALITNIVSFTAATAGAISFVVALIYQQQDLGRQARDYHEAGLKMNKLRRQLKITQLTNPEQLRQHIHTYDDILVSCNNHDEIDFEYAQLGPRPRDNAEGRLDFWIRRRRRLDFRTLFETYRLLVAIWVVPPLLGFAIWFGLSGHATSIGQIVR